MGKRKLGKLKVEGLRLRRNDQSSFARASADFVNNERSHFSPIKLFHFSFQLLEEFSETVEVGFQTDSESLKLFLD